MSPKFLLASAGLMAALSAHATVSVTGPSFTYSQNFDSLPASGSVTFVNDSTLPGWSLYRSNGTALTVTAGNGSNNGGGFYSFGTGTSSDRALGSVASSSTGTMNYALALTNNSGAALAGFTLLYDGEQWRNGGNTNVQSLTFDYGFGSSYSTVAWQSAGAGFNFNSLVNTATAGTVDGSSVGKTANIGGTVTTGWAAGQTLWVRWTDIDDVGADHGLAIDNVRFNAVAAAVPEPSTYAMLLAGIGAIGFIARRRRS
ncbi:PEP-CTERM sorting domain-containing protein [Roseateles sp.]|uniref:PEP-CTERM sorting domain-containing protein n=1 Tax=Roseateles sp. TaxID=1971397 RepID=UPI0025D34362|nr:PEP-CTERM sorting domain-containing protein [Roseateles sp.]MBV8037305.1 PEP-CTERM sorting domain-containing protein [Roseateles sp.]